MKCLRCITLLVLVVTLAGCRQASPITPSPTSPAVFQDASSSTQANVSASGVVVPAQETRMAFTRSGRVKDVVVAIGDRVSAGDPLIVLDSPELDACVAEAEAALRAAQAEWEFWMLPRKGKGPEHRELASTRVLQAQAALMTALALQVQSFLVAPFDATVVSVDVSTGEAVEPGRVVIVLADLEHLQIETTDLSERDVSKVKVGQSALVKVEALGQEIPAQVTRVAPRASIYNGDVVYKVILSMSEQPQVLRWGMNVEVEIRTGAQ